MAIEMVNRKINFLWNNGAGIQSITHNVSIEQALGGDLASQVSHQKLNVSFLDQLKLDFL